MAIVIHIFNKNSLYFQEDDYYGKKIKNENMNIDWMMKWKKIKLKKGKNKNGSNFLL